MRYKLYTFLLVLLIIALFIAAMAGVPKMYIGGGCAAMLIVLTLLIRSVYKPLHAVENGIYLLRDQDFGSRLRKIGQPDADKIVELYNTLIDSMKAERLKTLEQNKFLSQVIDVSPMGIAICNFDGEIVDTNRAWNAMQSPSLVKAIESVGVGETQTVRLADALIVRISKLWFMDMGFKRNFILVEKLTEEILSAEKQMFNKIVRTIGHEVNNTLGSVISVLESLGEMHEDDRLIKGAIESSGNSCTNLVNFVRGYADIVKLPAAAPECVDLNQWLIRILPTLSRMAPANVEVRFTPLDGSCNVSIDPMLMERVFINIVKNAIESIGDRPDGMVEITVTPSESSRRKTNGGETCTVAITDNGKGISEEAAEKLFTPFFSTKRPDRGLGMMLITDILRAHRARFSLATDPATRLTTFSLTL